MIDDPNGVDADRQRAEFLATYWDEVPRLTVHLWSLARGTGWSAADIDDILQETHLRVLTALARPGFRPDDPRAYLSRVMTNCFVERCRQAKRQPVALADFDRWITDPNTRPPDEAIEERAERDRAERRMEEAAQWAARFLATLSELAHVLGELPRLEDAWPPPDGRRGRDTERRPRRGRPTQAERIRRIVRELPGQIALVEEYFQNH